ncbi:unnamed protein product [Cylindrotheca closterium]|uniref:L domain-like protein n=1 Tax=Cylindrotheca closterium TaxID=2856 RepID=A0AAD2CM17_9STRA|nr:unnamed protein product [Cylindrotheca closterium]
MAKPSVDKSKPKSKQKKNVANYSNPSNPPIIPGDLELDPIPEDTSVAPSSRAGNIHNNAMSSAASAVASSNSSSSSDMASSLPQNQSHQSHQSHQQQRRQQYNRNDSGSRSDVTGSAVNELMYGADSEQSPPHEKPPEVFCNKRVRIFTLFLILLLAGIGVGIHFIVQAIDEENEGKYGNNNNNHNNLGQPTMPPTYPTFDDVFIDGPTPVPTYSPIQIQSIDDVLLELSAETRNVVNGNEVVNLNDQSTAHGNCRFWLTQNDEIDLNVDVNGQARDIERIQQRYILCLLFEHTSGQNWQLGNGTFKDKTAHECTWEGVTCNGYDYVAVLDLWNKNLVGSIPEEITSLATLQVLRLPNNTLVGTIPERLLDLPDLLWLDLSNNQLTGSVVSSTASGSSLLTLYLNANGLQGTIPYFPQLTSLRIHGNQFNQLNELYTTSTPLRRLVAYNNNFQSTFPQTWNSPNLMHLDLGLNQWMGSIPPSLWQTTPKLEFLLLNDGQLQGNLPSTTASSNLQYVWLQSNQLTGTVPETFGQNWMNLTSLQLQDNDGLRGRISASQCMQWEKQTFETFPEVIRADCNFVSCSCCTSCS